MQKCYIITLPCVHTFNNVGCNYRMFQRHRGNSSTGLCMNYSEHWRKVRYPFPLPLLTLAVSLSWSPPWNVEISLNQMESSSYCISSTTVRINANLYWNSPKSHNGNNSGAGVINADTIVAEVIVQHASVVNEIINKGKTQKLNFLLGQCMRRTGGNVQPSVIREKLESALKK